ncbi:MAG: right-handed parallel beta-helix repeat-containing protein [Chloroflexi bacterium]|nr:right-handed parallel beta-helix repeat-containing protein [Chloroflexota bacterium]
MLRRRLAPATATVALLAGLLPGATGIALAVTPSATVYDAIPAALPGNVVSLGFEATSTSEFGDLVRLAPGPRQADSVDVVMSSWGCETGAWSTADCVTTPGATFSHPITLNIYATDTAGEPTGSPIVSETDTFAIPYRPSPDTINCTGGRWYDTGSSTCFNGLATTITFNLAGETLPSELIWTVAYNTTNYGAAPIGTADCGSNCGYDSLNVGAESFGGSPSPGTDIDPDGAVLSSTWAGAYCDGGTGGTGSLRLDTGTDCWTDYRPLARIKTHASSASSSTVVVNEANMQGWGFYEEIANADGALVTGPGTPPLGTGSARMTLDATGREILLTQAYAGTPFDRITSLSYSTYRSSADSGNNLAIAIQFDTDYDLTDANTSWQGRLVFEPYLAPGAGGTVVQDTWQSWNALQGNWWASGAPGNTVCPQASPCSWAQVLSSFPNAGIRAGGYTNLKAGGPAQGFDGNVDAFRIAVDDGTGDITDTTYDFDHVDLLGPCAVSTTGSNPVVYTLLADCVTDHTVVVPQNAGGSVLDGNGHSITGVDPSGGHFLGAVVQAEAGTASITVRNLTVTVSGLADVCDADADRLRGILFDAVPGAITNNTVTGIRQGTTSGCQEGNAIDVRKAPFGTGGSDATVTISGNTITGYQKTGIVASGSVAATITSNTIVGDGPVTYIAQNGIQVGFGATAIVKFNSVSRNTYTPADTIACGLLIYQADGVKASSNSLFDNERNQCNFGKGGGSFNPAP